jgi:hypothetical protein
MAAGRLHHEAGPNSVTTAQNKRNVGSTYCIDQVKLRPERLWQSGGHATRAVGQRVASRRQHRTQVLADLLKVGDSGFSLVELDLRAAM